MTESVLENKMSKETTSSEKLNKTEVNSEAEKTDFRKLGTDMNYKFKPKRKTQIFIVLLHISALLGLYYCFQGAKFATVIWAAVLTVIGIQAVVLGAHRAYSHHSFKPSQSLKIALVFFHVMAGQNSIFWWARDHRVHHRYSDTDADPYNASRGFFFSHINWYLVQRHPLVDEKARQVDVTDLLQDKWLMFQRKYFWEIYSVMGVLMPVMVPVYCWNESLKIAFCICYSLRYTLNLHSIFTINSFAHMYGSKPFDKRINPVQSKLVHWATGGDGWHNFHHCFPWDYGLSEYGYGKGLSTLAIEFFAKYGFATDLKKASMNVVQDHSKRHGDESNHLLNK